MTTRISTGQHITSFINQINENRARLEKSRQEISSGLKITKPSDDSGRSGTIINLQSLSQRIDAHLRRTDLAINNMDFQETAVSSANETLIRAQELATQAANGSTSEDVRRQIADEVFQLRDQLVSIANTKEQNRYIYGGYNDQEAPYQLNETFYPTPGVGEYPKANTRYELANGNGQDQTGSVRISDSESIRTNSTARDVFHDAINSVETLGRALVGVRTDMIDTTGDTIPDSPDPAGTHLPWNLPAERDQQTAAITNAIDNIKDARNNHIETELSSIGARVNRLDQNKEILTSLKLNAEESRSRIQEADIFESSAEFTNLQTSLEALLASGSRISSLNLLDFL